MGKDEESLEASRKIRGMLKERWGIIPSSVMQADWSIRVLDFSESYQDQKKQSKFGADSPFSLSGVGARHGALSRMPQNIVKWCCQFYLPEKLSEPGYFGNGLPTVLDPFCLTPETRIVTSDGYKKIEDVQVGDLVLTHKRRFMPVTKKFEHDYSGELIEVSPFGLPKLYITPNHQMWLIRSRRCAYNGRVALPSCYTCRVLREYERVERGASNYRGRRTVKCQFFYQGYSSEFIEASNVKKDDFVCFPIFNSGSQVEDGDFMRLAGLFVAEGHTSTYGVAFTVGAHEHPLANEIVGLLSKFTGKKTICELDRKSNVYRIHCSDKALAKSFRELFGVRAVNKGFPPRFLIGLSKDSTRVLLRAYFDGDGCRYNTKAGSGATAVTVSERLAGQLQPLLTSLGIAPSVYFPKTILNGDGGKWNIIHRHQPIHVSVHAVDLPKLYEGDFVPKSYSQTRFKLDNTFAYRIRSVRRIPYVGKIYNLSVLEDESYTTISGAVHNCGHNSRMESVWRCNRNYVGFDVSKNFMVMNRKVVEQLETENKASLFPIEAQIKLIEADSRDLLDYVAENSMDFCITSPPFWDLELDSYGNEPEQLGNAKLYSDFLFSLGTIVENCYKALRANSFIAFEFNDFRKEGRFYPFHTDGIRLFEKAGFIPWDVIVVDYGSGFLQSFAQDIEVNKIVSKEHSYLIVGRKIPKRTNRAKTRERLIEEVKEVKSEGSLEYQQELFDEKLPDI